MSAPLPAYGSLPELLTGQKQQAVAEPYPGEYYRHLGPPAVHGRWSKRRKDDRLRLIPGLLAWAAALPAEWDACILRRVESGFSDGRNGEDEFDAITGL